MNGEKIDHPEYYKGNKYEAIDIIDDYQLGFNLGNAVKKKATWYIEHEICKLMNEQEQRKEKRSKRCSECKWYKTNDCTMAYWVHHGTDIRNCTCCMWEAKK